MSGNGNPLNSNRALCAIVNNKYNALFYEHKPLIYNITYLGPMILLPYSYYFLDIIIMLMFQKPIDRWLDNAPQKKSNTVETHARNVRTLP